MRQSGEFVRRSQHAKYRMIAARNADIANLESRNAYDPGDRSSRSHHGETQIELLPVDRVDQAVSVDPANVKLDIRRSLAQPFHQRNEDRDRAVGLADCETMRPAGIEDRIG